MNAPYAEYKSALTPNEQMSAAVNKLIGSKSCRITQTPTLQTEKHVRPETLAEKVGGKETKVMKSQSSFEIVG